MRFEEVVYKFPALRNLHGGSDHAFFHVLYRTAHRSRDGRRACDGSGDRIDYQLWQLRVVALRLLIHDVLPKATIRDGALREAEWNGDGQAIVMLDNDQGRHVGLLVLNVPAAVWNELHTLEPNERQNP